MAEFPPVPPAPPKPPSKKPQSKDWDTLKDPNLNQDIDEALKPIGEALGQAVEKLGQKLSKNAKDLRKQSDDFDRELAKRNRQQRHQTLTEKAMAAAETEVLKMQSKNTANKYKIAKMKPLKSLGTLAKQDLNSISLPQPLETPRPIDIQEPPETPDDFSDFKAPDPLVQLSGLEKISKKFKELKERKEKFDEYKKGGFLDQLIAFSKMSTGGQFLVTGTLAYAGAAKTATVATDIWGRALTVLDKVFKATYNFINEKVLPTHADLNKALGASSEGMQGLYKQSMRVGDQFWDLGLSFEKGTQDVRELASAMNTAKIPDDALKSLVKVTEYVGVGAQQAGKLANTFLATGTRAEDLGATLNKVFIEAGVQAQKYNVPLNIISKDFADNIEEVQRYGTANYKSFLKSIAIARKYNTSIKEVETTFGKAMDTFENTSEIASKLNSVFGTSIDSLKVLNMESSADRMEYFRKELERQSLTWDKLNVPMKNVITNTLGITNAQGALFFGSQKTRKEQQALVKEQDANAKATQDWDKALSSMRRQLINVPREISILYRAIGNVIGRFFGFKDGTDATTKGVDLFRVGIETLSNEINKFAMTIPDNNDGFGSIANGVKRITASVDSASRSLGTMADLIDRITNPGQYNYATDWIEKYDQAIKEGNVKNIQFQEKLLNSSGLQIQNYVKSRYDRSHEQSYEPYEQKQEKKDRKKAKIVASEDATTSLSRNSSKLHSLARDYNEMTLPPMTINVYVETDRLGRTVVTKTVQKSAGQN